jgi:hypothetical protein
VKFVIEQAFRFEDELADISYCTATSAAIGNPVGMLFNKWVGILHRDGEIQL